MKYEVIGLDENLNVVNAIIHRTGIYNDGDICKDIEGDFYLRYICPLDTKTEKRSNRAIVLKEPLQNIKYIICNDKYELNQKESEERNENIMKFEEKDKILYGGIKSITIINGKHTDLAIDKDVFDIEFELIKEQTNEK